MIPGSVSLSAAREALYSSSVLYLVSAVLLYQL